jgi:spore protease
MKGNLRTDLIDELITETRQEKYDDITVTRIDVDEKRSKEIGKKIGKYITIAFNDITDYDSKEKVKKVFSNELSKMINNLDINEDASCLIVGLGNEKSTPDSLGPLSVKQVIVTNHLFELDEVSPGFRRTFAISPGVTGQTGIETSDLIKSIINFEKPNFLIVIDALASTSIERVNKTIQISDAGISPGSGIGNKRKEISEEVIGIPVIAIGVPTVVGAEVIVSDTINYMYKNIAYTKENINNPANKLKTMVNYLQYETKTDDALKKKLFGMIGSLNEEDTRKLILEVLTPIGYNLMVTPKEEDFIIEKISDVVSGGINMSLHKSVNEI